MDERLALLRRWASRASLPRLYTELALRLAGEGYELELQGEEFTVYGRRRAPGLRGWMGRHERTPLLRLVRVDGQVTVPEQPYDPQFVALLLARLKG